MNKSSEEMEWGAKEGTQGEGNASGGPSCQETIQIVELKFCSKFVSERSFYYVHNIAPRALLPTLLRAIQWYSQQRPNRGLGRQLPFFAQT